MSGSCGCLPIGSLKKMTPATFPSVILEAIWASPPFGPEATVSTSIPFSFSLLLLQCLHMPYATLASGWFLLSTVAASSEGIHTLDWLVIRPLKSVLVILILRFP
mgnify:CR=1 FL=1